MQAALGLYAEFDIYSGCKLGSTEAAGTALIMVYSSDGTQLYVLTAVSITQIRCRSMLGFLDFESRVLTAMANSLTHADTAACHCLQDRSLFTLSLPLWKRKVLLPPHKRYNMQKAHLALLGVRSEA